MRDVNTEKEGLVPSTMLEAAPEEMVVATASSVKRSIQKARYTIIFLLPILLLRASFFWGGGINEPFCLEKT